MTVADRMQKTIVSLQTNLASIRTGRAAVNMLDSVLVDAYQSKMPLNQLATTSVPEPRLLQVKAWDKALVANIEKALRENGMNPVIEGDILRIPVPPLTEERRIEMAKDVGKFAETARVAIRQIRKDERNAMDKSLGEDEVFALEKELDGVVEDFVQEINELADKKKGELLG